MSEIINKKGISERAAFLEKLLAEIRKRSTNPVKGKLKTSRSNGKIQYYYREHDNQKWIFVKNENRATVQKIAQRDYLITLRRSAEKRILVGAPGQNG